jgi:hypothetical protein
MIKKAINDLQDIITNNNLDLHQAEVGASLTDDGACFSLSFENSAFTKMKVSGLSYKNAPVALRRYYDEERYMIHVPTQRIIDHLGPIVVEAWVRAGV